MKKALYHRAVQERHISRVFFSWNFVVAHHHCQMTTFQRCSRRHPMNACTLHTSHMPVQLVSYLTCHRHTSPSHRLTKPHFLVNNNRCAFGALLDLGFNATSTRHRQTTTSQPLFQLQLHTSTLTTTSCTTIFKNLSLLHHRGSRQLYTCVTSNRLR